MKKLFAKYVYSEDGATAIEYGLIVASIALAIVVVVFAMGDSIETTFSTVSDNL